MEIVAALKSRKAAMEEKLRAKLEELKKICLEEGALSGQLPAEYPLGPGEAPPTIRRRVGTSFTLPENLLNKAKSSKVTSIIQREKYGDLSLSLSLSNETMKLNGFLLALLNYASRKSRWLPWSSSTRSSARLRRPP